MLAEFKNGLYGKKADRYKDEINRRNKKVYKSFLLIGIIMMSLISVFGLALESHIEFNLEFIIILLYFFLLYLVSDWITAKAQKHITAIYYISITPIMLIGILIGTYFDPQQPSITIMVLMCVMTLFIIDKPYKTLLYITGVAVVYLICCFDAKSFDMFIADFIDLIVFYIISLGVNYCTMCDKLNSVESFEKYRSKSEIDDLTGVYNRGTGVEKINKYIENGIYGALIMMDIDNFKSINDNHGHTKGDEVLKLLSSFILKRFPEKAIVFRMGGDEFAVYSLELTDYDSCRARLNKFMAELSEKFTEKGLGLTVNVSIGCCVFNKAVGNFNNLYKLSDESLYDAKKSGKNCFKLSEPITNSNRNRLLNRT